MYRIANRHKTRRRRSGFWLGFTLLFLAVTVFGLVQFLKSLHQTTAVSSSKAVITKISYQGKVKHYNEGNFNIDIPAEWQLQPRPPQTYQSYTWHGTDKANSTEIEVYEDTIPTTFAVNRALIISGEGNHIELTGQASDNCAQFTKDSGGGQAELGIKARWQNVDFLCDRNTPTRDVVGTSSTDGINTVVLKSTDGMVHKYFFTYTDNQLSADYTIFYNALSTFSMN